MGDNFEKLATLATLHEKGLVSEKDFEKQKKKLLKKKWPLWIRIPLIILGVFLIGTAIIGIVPMGSSGTSKVGSIDLPTCESSQAQSTLAGAIKNNADANVETMSLVSLTNQNQVSIVESPAERDCSAVVYLNDGKSHNISYKITAPDPNNTSQFMVQYQISN